jgi:hypothetical protein
VEVVTSRTVLLFSGDATVAGVRCPVSRIRLTLSAIALVALSAVALSVAWTEATGGRWHAVPYALVFAVLFGLAAVHGVLLFRAPDRRRGRPRTEQIDGQSWTVLPNATGQFAVLAGLMGCLVALPALVAFDSFRTGASGGGVLFAVVAAGFGSYLVDVAMGRLAVGHVTLGPDGLRQRGRSFESFLSWESAPRVLPVPAGVPMVVVSWDSRAGWERRRTSLWRIDRLPNTVTMDVDAGISALPPALVRDVIAFYVAHPEAHHELGTPAAIARFADRPQEQGGPR